MRHAYELFKPVFDEERDSAMEAHAEDQRHREMNLEEALDECHAKGVSKESLQTLLFETGSRWTPKEIK